MCCRNAEQTLLLIELTRELLPFHPSLSVRQQKGNFRRLAEEVNRRTGSSFIAAQVRNKLKVLGFSYRKSLQRLDSRPEGGRNVLNTRPYWHLAWQEALSYREGKAAEEEAARQQRQQQRQQQQQQPAVEQQAPAVVISRPRGDDRVRCYNGHGAA